MPPCEFLLEFGPLPMVALSALVNRRMRPLGSTLPDSLTCRTRKPLRLASDSSISAPVKVTPSGSAKSSLRRDADSSRAPRGSDGTSTLTGSME
ncbi:hypothetical protein HMPREF3121_01685 [Corynebacterium sp. HMSC11E11]|nr:hypothetical protein HMPREF3121_01685 [Corynebacterium sp. HMSC11E11]